MYTFIAEENRESKKVKGINENVTDDELKYDDYENVSFNRLYMRHQINRIQGKDHNIDRMELIKFLYLLTMIKNIYLKKDVYSRLSHFHKSTR